MEVTSQGCSYLLICHNGEAEVRHSRGQQMEFREYQQEGEKENFTKDI